MKFYLLSLDRPPEILHAHRYQTAQYEMTLPCRPGCCEIAHIEQGQVIHQDGTVYEEGCIAVLPWDREQHLHSDAPVHCHFTFAFRTDSPPVILTAKEVTELIPADNCVILPEQLPPGGRTEELQKVIRKIISIYASVDHGRYLRLQAEVYRLFALLTETSVSLAAASGMHTDLQNRLYCQRAIKYLTEHIAEKINAADVAAYVGVSYGYLSRIFRSCVGMTLVEYSNHVKIQRVRELIVSRNISLTDAGLSVGIDDVKYLSRLFKKYSGITSAEYRGMYRDPRYQGTAEQKRKEESSC